MPPMIIKMYVPLLLVQINLTIFILVFYPVTLCPCFTQILLSGEGPSKSCTEDALYSSSRHLLPVALSSYPSINAIECYVVPNSKRSNVSR